MRYIGLCAVLLFLQTGCSKTDTVPPSDNERTIGFTTVMTRAAKEDFGAGDAFAVWGWYTPQDAFSQVFDATRVSTSDGVSWSYENLRFGSRTRHMTFMACILRWTNFPERLHITRMGCSLLRDLMPHSRSI